MISGLTGDATAVVKMEYFHILGEDRMRFGKINQTSLLFLLSPFTIFVGHVCIKHFVLKRLGERPNSP